MILIASDWLAICAVLSVFAWFANRRFIAAFLPFAAIIAALAVYIPLGKPTPVVPKAGRYTVLGADIQVNVAIFALLKQGDMEPVYVKLPYSASSASQLQNALDGAENGQGVQATIDGDGGQTYDGATPVHGDEPKVPEAPALTLP
jgi:hypothetical protein